MYNTDDCFVVSRNIYIPWSVEILMVRGKVADLYVFLRLAGRSIGTVHMGTACQKRWGMCFYLLRHLHMSCGVCTCRTSCVSFVPSRPHAPLTGGCGQLGTRLAIQLCFGPAVNCAMLRMTVMCICASHLIFL